MAKGEPAWEFPTEQGDVLYFCLEDSYSRIQNRLLDITDDAPPNLFFARKMSWYFFSLNFWIIGSASQVQRRSW